MLRRCFQLLLLLVGACYAGRLRLLRCWVVNWVVPRLLGTGRAHPPPIYSLGWDGFEPTGAVGDRRRRTGGPGRRSRSREAHDTRLSY